MQRIAFMEGMMFGVPFNGLDYFNKDTAKMQGELFKRFEIFNYETEDLVKGSMLTYLAECFIIPTSLLNEHFTFETANDKQVKAVYKDDLYELSGLFTFNTFNEMISFETIDRPCMDSKGIVHDYSWKAECSHYITNEEEYRIPSNFKASWIIDGEWCPIF
ncbi:DUF6544 family protein [Macrococcus animalis]|uniref:DUF6544 family protein n=1 Tax=Macrococcus animalis TaxID=3395467 RepID=UPI0039BDE8DB